MAVIPVKKVPDPILSKRADKVKKITNEAKATIKNLLDTLDAAKEPEGAGLAATQIGVPKRICMVRDFVQDLEDPEKVTTTDYVLINPRIVSESKETQVIWEGCLSVPDVYGQVERPKKIKVRAEDEEGNKFQLKAEGFLASVIQHEMDHLDGVIFTSKVQGDTLTEKELEDLYAQKEKQQEQDEGVLD